MDKLRQNISSLVAALRGTGTTGHGDSLMHVARTWLMLLSIVTVAIAALVVSGVYIYFRAQDVINGNISDPATASTLTIDRNELTSVLETYRERVVRLEELRRVPMDAPSPGYAAPPVETTE